jgi:hypothetical protein
MMVSVSNISINIVNKYNNSSHVHQSLSDDFNRTLCDIIYACPAFLFDHVKIYCQEVPYVRRIRCNNAQGRGVGDGNSHGLALLLLHLCL